MLIWCGGTEHTFKWIKRIKMCGGLDNAVDENKLVFVVWHCFEYMFGDHSINTDAYYMCTARIHTYAKAIFDNPLSFWLWLLFFHLNALFSSSFYRFDFLCLKITKIHKCWWHWIFKQYEWFFYRWSTKKIHPLKLRPKLLKNKWLFVDR